MKPLDAAPVNEEDIVTEMEPFLVSGQEEHCRNKVRDVVSAIRKGGETLADMTHSICAGLDGFRMIAEMGDAEGIALLQYTQKLVEICAREQSAALKRVAESN